MDGPVSTLLYARWARWRHRNRNVRQAPTCAAPSFPQGRGARKLSPDAAQLQAHLCRPQLAVVLQPAAAALHRLLHAVVHRAHLVPALDEGPVGHRGGTRCEWARLGLCFGCTLACGAGEAAGTIMSLRRKMLTGPKCPAIIDFQGAGTPIDSNCLE